MLTVYKASAGSGKTYTLAYQYIKMLLGVKLESGRYVLNHKKYLGSRPLNKRPHSHILAITFTNKATAEMKSRIISELDRLGYMPKAGEKDSPYAADLMAEYGCERTDLAEVALKSMQALLHDYSAFNISTIDAFFQTILRTFAREIDRQGDYRLEIDNTYAISSATSMLFDDVNDRNPEISSVAGDWMKDIAFNRMKEGRDFNPFNRHGDLYKSVSQLLKKSFDDTFEKFADKVHDYISNPDNIKAFISRLDELSEELINREVEAGKLFLDALHADGYSEDDMDKNLLSFFLASINNPGLGDAQMNSYKKSTKYVTALIERDATAKLFLKRCAPSPAVYNALFDWAEKAIKSMLKREIYETLKASIKTLRALAFINDYIVRFRLENNMILIDDTNALLGSIICESDTPFIYERVGVELHNFLIDEFQDTSKQQWRNLKPLLLNSLADQHDSLIIGDVKQSIYRFRNADSDLLDHVVEKYDFPNQHVTKGAGEGENTNYRSAHGIVRFNNTVFHRLAVDTSVPGYDGVAQALPDTTAGLTSHICIRNLTNDFVDRASDRYLNEEEKANIYFGDLDKARAISLYITGREIMRQHERGYKWRDIVILTRKNKDSQEIAEYFMRVFPEIKLASEEALLLRNSKSIKLIISILEIIDKSYVSDSLQLFDEDDERLRKTVNRRRAMMIDRFEYLLAHGEDVNVALEKALNFSEEVSIGDTRENTIVDDINTLRGMAPANLAAMIEAIIQQKISMEQRREERAYIDAFLDVVTDFSNNYIPTIHTFLDFWNQKSNRLAISESKDQDAVLIMTVHKAKGLEWDCVHIPLMDWKVEPEYERQWFTLDNLTEVDESIRPPLMYLEGSSLLAGKYSPIEDALKEQFDKGVADNLNAAYVAFTRAVRELHINMCSPLKNQAQRKLFQALIDILPAEKPNQEPMYMTTSTLLDDSLNFEYGEPTYPQKKKTESKEQRHPVIPGEVEITDFNVAFSSLNRQVTQVDDLVSKTADLFDPNIGNDRTPSSVDIGEYENENMREAAKRGVQLHNILADTISLYDLEDSIIRNSRYHSPDEIEDFRSTLSEAIAAAGNYGDLWFDVEAPRVLTEAPIFLPEKNENYRVDRIVWTREGTIDIIDYKFTSRIQEKHKQQVRDYAKLLESMGYDNIRMFVWYPLSGDIIQV